MESFLKKKSHSDLGISNTFQIQDDLNAEAHVHILDVVVFEKYLCF